AEDGIRDRNVTGVQTCALPICACAWHLETGQHAQQGGLAAAGGAEQGEEFVLRDVQAHVRDGGEVVEELGHSAQGEQGPLLGGRSEERRVGRDTWEEVLVVLSR